VWIKFGILENANSYLINLHGNIHQPIDGQTSIGGRPQAGHHEAGTCEMLSPPFSPRLDEKSNIYFF
jgi:hypothetical protein